MAYVEGWSTIGREGWSTIKREDGVPKGVDEEPVWRGVPPKEGRWITKGREGIALGEGGGVKKREGCSTIGRRAGTPYGERVEYNMKRGLGYHI